MGIIPAMYTFATSNPCNPFALKDRYFCPCFFAALKKQSRKVEYEKKKTEKESGVLQEGRLLSAHRVHQNIYMKQSVEKNQRKSSKTYSEEKNIATNSSSPLTEKCVPIIRTELNKPEHLKSISKQRFQSNCKY